MRGPITIAAAAYSNKGDNDRAIKDYSEAIRLDPKYVRAYGVRGDAYRGKSDFDRAARDYGKAIELAGKPEKAHWTYWLLRGVSYERLGKWPQAEADFLKAMELDPDQPSVLNQLGYNWVERNFKLKEGLALLEKAVKLKPDDGNMLDSLGWAHYRLGDYQEAIKLLERAAALEPKNSEIRDHLGDAYWRTGRQDEARKSWEQALSLKPDPADAQKIKGKIARGLEK